MRWSIRSSPQVAFVSSPTDAVLTVLCTVVTGWTASMLGSERSFATWAVVSEAVKPWKT